MARVTRGRRGVSEVIGALLLIVVVVSAVASLAYFVSSAQQQAQNRSLFLTNLQNDNLQTVYALFSPNDPTIQWELDSITPGSCVLTGYTTSSWYVQQIPSNTGEVNLIPETGPGTPPSGVTFNAAHFYSSILKGVKVLLALGTPDTIAFGAGSPNCVFEAATWGSITLTVRNENTQASSLQGIQINGVWRSPVESWYEVDQSGANVQAKLGTGAAPLAIPAKASVSVLLNRTTFGGTTLAKNDSATIALLSGVGNYFTTVFSTPTALVKSSTSSQTSQTAARDIVTFDGSQSYAAGSSIQSYEWRLDIPTAAYAGTLTPPGCTPAAISAFANPTDYDTAYVTGETMQYTPESVFPSSNIGDCITGPVRATLIVTDGSGFLSQSQPIVVSPDSTIAPVGGFSYTKTAQPCTSPCTLTVTVVDIFGRPVDGAVVTAVRTSGDVVAPPAETTSGPSGQAAFTSVTWTTGGSLQIDVANLPTTSASFP